MAWRASSRAGVDEFNLLQAGAVVGLGRFRKPGRKPALLAPEAVGGLQLILPLQIEGEGRVSRRPWRLWD
jgi:hypothetical protein